MPVTCSTAPGRGLARGQLREGSPLFTDFTFDNLGVPKNPANPQGLGFTDKGLGGFLLSRPDYSALAAANLGKHKVPTLRNVDLRPTPGSLKAYGHNGYFKSLGAIVHFYNTRDVKPRCQGAYTEAQHSLRTAGRHPSTRQPSTARSWATSD